jgi:hypothetical protein
MIVRTLYTLLVVCLVTCKVKRRVENVKKGLIDKASYLFIELENGLEALIISDPGLDKVPLFIDSYQQN